MKVEVDLDWKVMEPVIMKLLDEDWDFKFENDADDCELQEIAESSVDVRETIKRDVEYFRSSGRDIIKATRLLIEPYECNRPIVLYYGERLESYDEKCDEYMIQFLKMVEAMKGVMKNKVIEE